MTDCAAPELLLNSWYHGNVSREASEVALAGQEAFAFLVRDSHRAPNTFTVSVVTFSGGIGHLMLSPVEECGRVVGFKIGKSEDPTIYRSIQHLIDVYTAVTGRMKVLGRAVPRVEARRCPAKVTTTAPPCVAKATSPQPTVGNHHPDNNFNEVAARSSAASPHTIYEEF
jgi:hypothetical protein